MTAEADKKKPWGDDFDEEKAWTLIQNLRADKTELQGKVDTLTTERDTAVSALQAKENEKLSDIQKLEQRLTRAEQRATEAEQGTVLERILRKYPDLEELKDMLTGKDEAEITAKAERLSKLGKPSGDENPDPNADPNGAGAANGGAGRPTPALTPGHGGEQPTAFDPVAIANAARNQQFS